MANLFQYLPVAFEIVGEFEALEAEFEAGQPVTVPEIKTYIGKQHVSVNVTVTPLAS
jgi:hypothetical protein